MFEKILIIFDLANNHMGDVEHGKKIIKEFSKVIKKYKEYFKFGFKMQYRELDSFIHPNFKNRFDIKYVKRFSETRLTKKELKELKDTIVEFGFVPICTPFDEASVDLIIEHNFRYIKIASCSLTDWPLLEYIVKVTDKPMILSTAGATIKDIDRVVSFLSHRKKIFALMHCRAEYPTIDENLYLNQIDFLKKRYPDIPIGFSTHEEPENYNAIIIAISKGIKLLEKHVGLITEKYNLNTYSSTPEQIDKWLQNGVIAIEMMGNDSLKEKRYPISENEKKTLFALQRGAFAKRDILKHEEITINDVFFAIPTIENQFVANDFSKYTHFKAIDFIKEKDVITKKNCLAVNKQEKIYEIVTEIKYLIRKAGLTVPPGVELEISHHYGIEKFYESGMVIITIVNREYCKKLLILLPGQFHPEQYHLKKEETFFVIYGEVELFLDGVKRVCRPGEVITIEKGVRHKMKSEKGCIIEEISSTHFKDDSFYTDETILNNKRRKTVIAYWQD